jgi:hypothetical protein
MSDALGTLAKAAFKKDRGLYGAGPAIAYPQVPGATDLGATHMIPFSSETMTTALEYLEDVRLIGAGGQLPADVISDKVLGGVEGPLAYQGWERLLMAALGYENPDASPVTLVSGAYAHLFECEYDLQDSAWNSGDDRIAGGWSANDRKVRRGQIGFRKQVTDWVFGSVFVNKMTLSGNPKEVKIAFDLIGYDLYLGAYNSASWTLPAGSAALSIFPQLVVKVGTRAGGTAGLATMGSSSFELVVNNNLKADDQSNTSGTHILQPVRGGMQNISLKLDFPRYNTDLTNLIGYSDDNTELAASLAFTGPIIGVTAYNHMWNLFMSSLRAKNPNVPITGPAPLTVAVEFDVSRPGGTDIFNAVPATYYHSIALKKDSALVACIHNAFATNYLLEV